MKRVKIESRPIRSKVVRNGNTVWYRENSSDLLMYEENAYKNIQFLDTDVVMDIGANMGDVPLRYAKSVKFIHSYEPMADTFEILNLNVTHNEFNNCQTYQCAVTRNVGEVTMWLNEKAKTAHSTASVIKRNGERSAITVPSISFEDEVKRIKPTIIKMDIEGAEIDILDSVDDSIFDGVRAFLLEVHLNAIKHEDPEEWNHKLGQRFSKIFDVSRSVPVYFGKTKTAYVWEFFNNV